MSTGSGVDESEIFRDLTVDGSFRPNGDITVRVDVEQPYPVPVTVDCDLLEDDEETKVTDILSQDIPANVEGAPVGTATPLPGDFEQAFRAPSQPGRYLVKCVTPLDENNAIGEWITIQE